MTGSPTSDLYSVMRNVLLNRDVPSVGGFVTASGENDRCPVSQISPGYYNMNAVAFYLLKGRLLVAYEVQGTATTCVTFRNVEPDEIAVTLNEKLGFPFNAMCLVMSSRTEVLRRYCDRSRSTVRE